MFVRHFFVVASKRGEAISGGSAVHNPTVLSKPVKAVAILLTLLHLLMLLLLLLLLMILGITGNNSDAGRKMPCLRVRIEQSVC
jgi:hypothetical protein